MLDKLFEGIGEVFKGEAEAAASFEQPTGVNATIDHERAEARTTVIIAAQLISPFIERLEAAQPKTDPGFTNSVEFTNATDATIATGVAPADKALLENATSPTGQAMVEYVHDDGRTATAEAQVARLAVPAEEVVGLFNDFSENS